MTKSRKDVVKFITKQFEWGRECTREKKRKYHYGQQELRELLDFIFDGPPKTPSENLQVCEPKSRY